MNDSIYTRGYIALITTLVVGSLAVLVTVGMLSIGITQTQTSQVSMDYYQAYSLSDACVEYALQEIRDSGTYTGTQTLSIGTDSCEYEVANTGGTTRRIEAQAELNNTNVKSLVEIDELNPDINITRWEYVTSF